MKPDDVAMSASERTLGRVQLRQAVLYGLLGTLFTLQLVWREEHAGSWFVMLVVTVFYISLGAARITSDLWALSAWRRFSVTPGEMLVWGTSAQLISPSGGAFHGIFALSTVRLRYRPRLVSRLRGAMEKEWPLGHLGAVRVTPVDGRRKYRGGRWVELDVMDSTPITLINTEPHAVADDLFESLRKARSAHDAGAVVTQAALRTEDGGMSR